MNFATWSIRNPIPAILLFCMMTVFGLYGFHKLSIQNLPDVDLPSVNVALSLPGAAPEQLETEVARKVEDSLATLAGLKHIKTTITEGRVIIVVEFVLEKSLSDALIETKNAVDAVRSNLPADLEPPTVAARTVQGTPLVTYAIASPDMNEEALSWFVDNTLSKAILSIRGVGKFERIGGVDREIQVEVQPDRLAALNVTAADISHALKQEQMEESGGHGQVGKTEQSVRVVGTVPLAVDLQAMPITLSDGRRIRLDQVATIKDAHAERTQKAEFDGQPVMGFQIYRANNSDETQVIAAIQQALNKMQVEHPNLTITPITNTADYTLRQYHGSMEMLYEGALLAVIVVWFFLRDWRATIISATALPLSIIPTFAVMKWFGFSLNTLSLLAMAVVVGILVDDAIVEVENIVRHKRMGKTVREAAEDAINEIALAVMATTLTLVVVFLPTAMMGGISGLFFRQFGWTVVISVLASLLVARLLTPVMAIYFLKEDNQDHSPDGPLMTRYLTMVHWCLSYRKSTGLLALLFFAGSILLATQLSSSLIPATDRGFTKVSFELPPGSSLENSQTVAELVRKNTVNIDGVSHLFTTIGEAQTTSQGSTQAREVRKGSVTFVLKPRNERKSQIDIENAIRKELLQVPGARFTLSSGSTGEKLSIILAGDQTPALIAVAQGLEKQMRDIHALNNISSTASLERPEIIVRPNPARTADLGVTTATIGETVRIATAGDFDPLLAKLNLDDRQLYIRVRFPEAVRQDANTIAGLRVPTRSGELTALSNVADISTGTGPAQIDRYDRHRYVTISADLGGTPLGDAMASVMALPAIKNMPSSVSLLQTGDAEIMQELSGSFGIAILTGVLSVFCVLVLLFKDFFQPVTILSALPLSLGGAIIALLATRSQMNLPALIGIVMLMGIVTKNSILLVEYTIVAMRERGMQMHDAIIDACHKRARPIVMTTIAMIAGMLPIAMGFGGDASFRQAMAIAVIGGLITSTALSLLVVPVTFTYIHSIELWFCRFAKPKI